MDHITYHIITSLETEGYRGHWKWIQNYICYIFNHPVLPLECCVSPMKQANGIYGLPSSFFRHWGFNPTMYVVRYYPICFCSCSCSCYCYCCWLLLLNPSILILVLAVLKFKNGLRQSLSCVITVLSFSFFRCAGPSQTSNVSTLLSK